MCMQIPGQEEETQALLQLKPHRIGHGTFLKTTRDDTSELVEHVRNLNIPLGEILFHFLRGGVLGLQFTHIDSLKVLEEKKQKAL